MEALRLVAMAEIIASHLFGPLPLLDGLGLPIFLLLSVAFSVAAVERHGMRAITLGKLRGIGVPWLLVVYAASLGLVAWLRTTRLRRLV